MLPSLDLGNLQGYWFKYFGLGRKIKDEEQSTVFRRGLERNSK